MEMVDLRSVCMEVVALVAAYGVGATQANRIDGHPKTLFWVEGTGACCFRQSATCRQCHQHTAPGTTVEVDVQPNGTVRVLDEGPGVPEDKTAIDLYAILGDATETGRRAARV